MSNLAVVNHAASAPVVFDRHAAIQAAVEKRNTLIEFVRAVMAQGVDYGKVPGTDKDTLFKPGAEKLCTLFSYLPSYEAVEKVEDWTGADHNGEAFFFYHYKCSIADQSGRIIATGEGSVNSWEKKYRYRDAKPVCPHCGQPTVYKSKDTGYFCWKKHGGCGATFPDGDPQITSQPVGKVPNPDIFDAVNTMMKMAQKRALVAAVLLACNASEFFTQDVEDLTILDAQIVTTAHARPQPSRPTQVYEVAQVVPLARLDAVRALTGHTEAQVYTIAAQQKPPVNPEQMTSDDFLRLRNALYGSWGSQQAGAFRAPKHAWNAFQSILNDNLTLSDTELFDAWSADVAARIPQTTEAPAVMTEDF